MAKTPGRWGLPEAARVAKERETKRIKKVFENGVVLSPRWCANRVVTNTHNFFPITFQIDRVIFHDLSDTKFFL